MNYQETMDYLYSKLPMFTRDGASALKKDLTNTLAFCKILDHPQKKFKSIHVAGTNGKGSTSHALAAIFQAAGYKTGLYTSPHLVDFRERIRINGEMVPMEYVIDFVANLQPSIEAIQPSFFEVTVAMAFDYFAKEQVDIAIIETGLGGRLDSTNIILPELSVITNIGWDHQAQLGDQLSQIAGEKAGIIKEHVPVIISEKQEDISTVFKAKAEEMEAPIVFASEILQSKLIQKSPESQQILIQSNQELKRLSNAFNGLSSEIIKEYLGHYHIDLLGSYQLKNVLGIISAVLYLNRLGWNLPIRAVKQGLSNLTKLTGLRGRWERLKENPLVICDTGHNEDGWKEIIFNISQTPHRSLHIVLGVMADKDLNKMLPLLPKDARYYFCQVDLPRALPVGMLAEKARTHGLIGTPHDSVIAAALTAIQASNDEDLIFVGGSTFVVGDLIAHEGELDS